MEIMVDNRRHEIKKLWYESRYYATRPSDDVADLKASSYRIQVAVIHRQKKKEKVVEFLTKSQYLSTAQKQEL